MVYEKLPQSLSQGVLPHGKIPFENASMCCRSQKCSGKHQKTKLSVCFNIVQTAFEPPPLPLVLNIYVADFSKVLLKSAPVATNASK